MEIKVLEDYPNLKPEKKKKKTHKCHQEEREEAERGFKLPQREIIQK